MCIEIGSSRAGAAPSPYFRAWRCLQISMALRALERNVVLFSTAGFLREGQ